MNMSTVGVVKGGMRCVNMSTVGEVKGGTRCEHVHCRCSQRRNEM